MNTSTVRCFPEAWLRLSVILASWLLVCLPVTAQEAARGALSGRVTQTATRKALESAVVTLVGTDRTTLTDARGEFLLPNLAPGTYTARVTYTGLDDAEKTVSVGAGAATTVDIAMTSEIYVMGQFVVAGEREGSAKAIQDQRLAPNLTTVISADQFGGVADGSIDDALKRLPGITYQQGEFSVRGIPNSLNSLEVNGVRLASASGGTDDPLGEDRSVKTNRIPGDLIEKIEVIKGLTPNRAADSVGGTINLITKSAFTSRGRAVNLQAGFTRVPGLVLTPRTGVAYNASWSDVVGVFGGERNLGVFVSASFNNIDTVLDRPFRANEQLSAFHNSNAAVPSYMTGIRLSSDVENHRRTNAGVKLDYRLFADSVVTLDLAVNRDDRLSFSERERLLTSSDSQIQAEQNGVFVPIAQATKVADRFKYTGVATSLENLRQRYLTDGARASLNGDHRLGDWQAQWRSAYSRDKSRQRDTDPKAGGTLRLDALTNTDFLVDRTDRRFPTFTVIGGGQPMFTDINNVRTTGVNQLRQRNRDSQDEIYSASLDVKRNFAFLRGTYVQAGASWRSQGRVYNDQATRNYRYVGGTDYRIFAGPPASIFHRYSNVNGANATLANLNYLASPANWVITNTNDSLIQSDAQNDGKIQEDVVGVYAMAVTEWRNLNVLAGVRQEITSDKTKGNVTDPRLPIPQRYLGMTERSGDYDNLVPSVHLKYRLRSSLQLRTSYSEGIGRPAFSNLRPRTTIDATNLRISQNNPDLRPQQTQNLDASLEWYFKPAGTLSAAIFRKDIKDYIFSVVSVLGADGGPFGSDYANWQYTRLANSGSARLEGYELNYAQQFTFLPGRLRGLGAFANYTHINSRTTFQDAVQQLANIIPNSCNVGVSYLLHPFSIRVLSYYRDTYPLQFDANPYSRYMREPSREFDVKLAYRLTRNLTLYCDIFNVTEEEPLIFAGPAGNLDRIVYENRRPRRFDFGVRAHW
jgi:TonB-dependent receptor